MHSKVRSLFVSDVHLGTPSCQAGHLLRLLNTVKTEKLYLVGDIVDLEAMHARAWWHPLHTRVIQRIFELAHSGTQVVYVPGNHDAQARLFAGRVVNGVRIERFADFTAIDGARYRIGHGDEFDETGMGKRQWIEALGDHLYRSICYVNRWYNKARSSLDLDYIAWSVGVKQRVKAAMHFIREFENRVLTSTQASAYDGYICGHIHYANVRQHGEVAYLNDGDWVEHCSVLVEPTSGGMELWQYTRRPRCLQVLAVDWWRDNLPAKAA